MQPDEYKGAVEVFTEFINRFIFDWEFRFKPDQDERLAMAEAFENIAQTLRNKATEES